jgi:hypothetical protein
MNGQLSAADVMALTNNDTFGGVGGFVLLFIFLMAISGNGFGWGNNGGVSQMATADLLYNQSTDAAIRGLAQGQCGITDTILNNKYDNAVLIKDLSNQMSNSVAALGNQISNQTSTITNLFNQQTIDGLRDKLDTTRAELSNVRQTAQITENILSNLATTAPKPPCYYGCGCGSSLY